MPYNFFSFKKQYGFFRQIFVQVFKIKFHENPTNGSGADVFRQTDRHTRTSKKKKLTGVLHDLGEKDLERILDKEDFWCMEFFGLGFRATGWADEFSETLEM